jgi:TfoX/Sxy family transcriptional regulator of competence genes
MTYDTELETLLDQTTRPWKSARKKKMFGGLVYTTGGNICVGIWRDHLILRAGPAAQAMMAADPRFRPFDVTGRAMTGWTMLAPEGWRDPDVRRQAIEKARSFCRTLPEKE